MTRRAAFLPLATFLLSTPFTTFAQDGLQACARIASDTGRLACFDALAAAAAPAAAPAIETATAAPAREFGLEHVAPPRDDENAVQALEVTVVSARHTDLTGWTIEFDNGQTWKQIGTERFDVKVGGPYVIKRGVMNSFQLQDEESGRRIRVRREE